MITRIVGLDLSLRQTGCAIYQLVDGTPQLKTSVFPEFKKGKVEAPMFEIRRLRHILITLTGVLNGLSSVPILPDEKQKTLIVIEGISFGSKGATVDQIAGMHWLIRYWLHQAGYPFIIVEPTRLKKFVLGKGNAQKDLILKGVLVAFGLDLPNSDEADAAALAYIGLAFCDKYKCTNEAQRSVIRDLKAANPHLSQVCHS